MKTIKGQRTTITRQFLAMTEKLFTKYVLPILDFNNYQVHRDYLSGNPCFFDKKYGYFAQIRQFILQCQ